MKIVLDATVLRADYPMAGAHWETFAKGLSRVPVAELMIPEIGLDEAVNGFRKDLRAAWKRLADEEHRLLGSARPNREGELEERTNEYRDRVIARVREIGGRVLPYPTIEHCKLVERDLAGRRPFDERGRGYRDALIWETIRELLAKGAESVVLVSSDGDFGDKALHEDLVRDLEDPGLVRLCKSLPQLNEELIVPRLKMLEDARSKLETSRAGIFDLAKWLEHGPMELLRANASDLPMLVAGFPTGVGVALPLAILDISSVRVLHVLDLTEHEVHVRIEAKVLAKVSLRWTGEEALKYPEVRKQGDGRIDYAAAMKDINCEIRMQVDLLVELKGKEVESEAIHLLETEHGVHAFGFADEWRRRGAAAAAKAASGKPAAIPPPAPPVQP